MDNNATQAYIYVYIFLYINIKDYYVVLCTSMFHVTRPMDFMLETCWYFANNTNNQALPTADAEHTCMSESGLKITFIKCSRHAIIGKISGGTTTLSTKKQQQETATQRRIDKHCSSCVRHPPSVCPCVRPPVSPSRSSVTFFLVHRLSMLYKLKYTQQVGQRRTMRQIVSQSAKAWTIVNNCQQERFSALWLALAIIVLNYMFCLHLMCKQVSDYSFPIPSNIWSVLNVENRLKSQYNGMRHDMFLHWSEYAIKLCHDWTMNSSHRLGEVIQKAAQSTKHTSMTQCRTMQDCS